MIALFPIVPTMMCPKPCHFPCLSDDGPIASNAANVGLQIGRGTRHTAIVVSVNVDPG